MKKDITVAILIGFAFGALAAFIVLFLPSLGKKGNQSIATTQVSQTGVPTTTESANSLTVDITEPSEGAVFNSKTFTIKGLYKNASYLVIDSESDSVISEASGSGQFNQDLPLLEGGNKITISAYDQKGESIAKSIMVFYTPEEK